MLAVKVPACFYPSGGIEQVLPGVAMGGGGGREAEGGGDN